jgi:8-oxo-dGTP pyrophosphatase MutT (NUDIX family)
VIEEAGKLSCGAAVVRRAETGWLVLMLRAYRNWDFPKGLKEAGETALEAAIREVSEETGISNLQFDWGEVFFETGPYNRGKIARYFLARTDEEQVTMGIPPGQSRPEHHEYRWVDFDQAYDLAAPRVRTVVQWARQVVGAR